MPIRLAQVSFSWRNPPRLNGFEWLATLPSAIHGALCPAGRAIRPETPGPGYTPEKARIALRNRYERGARPIATTLARLRRNPRFEEWVAQHRAEGRKDWWILLVLMNTILNFRARLAVAPNDVQGLRQYLSKAMYEDEPADAVEFPVA